MKVYKLYHTYISRMVGNEKYTSSFLLGFFNSIDIINNKIDEYIQQPGFKDHPDGFKIVEYDLSGDLQEVYYVDHEYYLPDEECDVVTEIGLFASLEEAEQAVEELKSEKDTLYLLNADGFVIEKYSINSDCMWQEGFTPW